MDRQVLLAGAPSRTKSELMKTEDMLAGLETMPAGLERSCEGTGTRDQ